jgi:hypothetical protein
MKESKKLEKQYGQLRGQLIAEISLLIKMHKDIEVEPEFKKPIAYAQGFDEQDEQQLIEQVDFLHVTIFHQGNEMEKVKYEYLNTDTLIEVLKGLENSLDEAKKFLDK